MIIAAVGKNASGKDYFLEFISREFGIPLLSIGDVVRELAEIEGVETVEVRVYENYTYINPGSVSIPKANSKHSYMILENGEFSWKSLDGESYIIK